MAILHDIRKDFSSEDKTINHLTWVTNTTPGVVTNFVLPFLLLGQAGCAEVLQGWWEWEDHSSAARVSIWVMWGRSVHG